MTQIESKVLYLFGFKTGTEPSGSFITTLSDAIMRADTTNSHKLYLGFPEYVDAVKAYQTGLNMAGERVDIWKDYKGDREL